MRRNFPAVLGLLLCGLPAAAVEDLILNGGDARLGESPTQRAAQLPAAPLPSEPPPNLLVNGDMERGIEGWGGGTADEAAVHGGRQSLRLEGVGEAVCLDSRARRAPARAWRVGAENPSCHSADPPVL